jgi:hypothetical protein
MGKEKHTACVCGKGNGLGEGRQEGYGQGRPTYLTNNRSAAKEQRKMANDQAVL